MPCVSQTPCFEDAVHVGRSNLYFFRKVLWSLSVTGMCALQQLWKACFLLTTTSEGIGPGTVLAKAVTGSSAYYFLNRAQSLSVYRQCATWSIPCLVWEALLM